MSEAPPAPTSPRGARDKRRSANGSEMRHLDKALLACDRGFEIYEGLDDTQPELREPLRGAYEARASVHYDRGDLWRAFPDCDRAIQHGSDQADKLRRSPWRIWGIDGPPERFNGVLPGSAAIDWQPEPLIPGEWCPRNGEAARPLLDALASLLRPFGPPGLLARIEDGTTALRARALDFYPGWWLCELRLGDGPEAGALPFLACAHGAVLLSGESRPVHALNGALKLRLVDSEQIPDYVRFFA
ncbi:MAG: hypothetical protein ACOYMV_12995, partial [Verrucomicrobiia bacterium]